jgi:hypothetical protein
MSDYLVYRTDALALALFSKNLLDALVAVKSFRGGVKMNELVALVCIWHPIL